MSKPPSFHRPFHGRTHPRTGVAALLALACAGQTLAQTPTLPDVVITANPLGASTPSVPSHVLQGPGLLLRRQSTLGETLGGLAGVSSTYFGPNASRPVIRGLDGDRIRILQNGSASLDASGLSYDHAVAADLLAVDRVEVIRGPAALLYGGSAVGGVVNLIDQRIARQPLFDAAGGVAALADVRAGGAARERAMGATLDTGTQRFTLHVDAQHREAGHTRVATGLPCTSGAVTRSARQICNSAARSDGLGLGGTLHLDRGYIGWSTHRQTQDYGAVAEDEVTIDMRRLRHALQAQLRLAGPIESVDLQWTGTDYAHTEFDAGAPGTQFTSRGTEWRVQARQARVNTALGVVEGVVGLQLESSRFSADGAEAFAPYSRTRDRAWFTQQELVTSWGRLSLGARGARVAVQSDGNPIVARFVPGQRSFNPHSIALGGVVDLARLGAAAAGWQATAHLARTARAPRDYELFADGAHIATGAYELGNASLGLERATSADVGVVWKQGPNQFAANAYASRFSSYLLLDATGRQRGADGEVNPVDADGDGVADASGEDVLPEYAYRATRARLRGLELAGSLRLLERGGTLDMQWRADRVHASDATTGQALPRIAPARLGATLVWASGALGARVGFDRHASQRRVPAGQLSTPGYTLWNAALTWRARAGASELLWYARLDNATDRLAWSAASILTQTAPGKAPLPGRGLSVGLQASF